MKRFSVVIPILNMANFVERVADSLSEGNFGQAIEEIIFVCDKSTDGTENEILRIQKNRKLNQPKIVLVQPEVRRGHFQARYMGAKAAKADKVFFIDARVTLPPRTKELLPEISENYEAMYANIDIDVNKNIFCLYWQRSHETIFRTTYRASREVHEINGSNYEQNRIGTTCFYCSRDKFIEVCKVFDGKPLFSDDTILQKRLVELEPIIMHPDFRVEWEPRNKTYTFLKHLYNRGPGFAEYHILERRGWLFYCVLLGVLFGLGEIALLFVNPLLAITLVVLCLLLMASTAAFIVKSIKEFFRLAPLHAAVMIFYGVGALRGIWVVYKARSTGIKA